jgi:hypothetical protein
LIVRSHLKSLRVNDQGTTAVEFAIVAPVFITLLIGTLALCVALFLIGSLHYAAEEGARCASVKTACQVNGVADAAATRTYAQNHYFGPTGPRMVKKLKLQERRAVIPSRRSRTACRLLRFLGRSMAPIADLRAKGGTYGATEADPG